MKGSLALIDDDRSIAALLVDGRLQDLMIDPPQSDPTPRPGAIYRAILDRPLKGMHGAMLKLPDGQHAFLKEAKGLSPGTPLLVQVSTFAEKGKAAPVVRKLLFKSRYVIVTPANPGINVARSIREDEERDRLLELAHDIRADGNEGLIMRSICRDSDFDDIAQDITNTLTLARKVLADTEGRQPALILDAMSAPERAWRDWENVDTIETGAESFAHHGIEESIEALKTPRVSLTGSAWISIEPTAALVAIDVNTGGDFSPAAGLKTNLAASDEIARQLLLRGIGGQITVDFAPLPKKDRPKIENALKSAFRRSGVDTIIAGWTPLGNLELQRKRERYPLSQAKL